MNEKEIIARPVFDSRDSENYDLYDSSDDYGMGLDLDVVEYIYNQEKINNGIVETQFDFLLLGE
tara:strand:- start:49 stop:240 length:192 start_codon:yes stop_codon:yes gene_type:complete